LFARCVNCFICYLAVFLSLFATLPTSAADATPTESINLSGKWSDGITIQQTGQSVSAYDSTGKNIFNGTLSGQTLNGQFLKPTKSEWQSCGGPAELWPKAKLTVSQTENSQTITGEQFENFKFNVDTCKVAGSFWDALSVSLTRTLEESKVEIVSVTSKYSSNTPTHFLDGLDHEVTYTAQIDWGGGEPGTVSFITPTATKEVAATGNTAEQSFNMGKDFGVCGKLKVVATSKDGKNKSPEKEVDFTVMSSFPLSPLLLRIEEGNNFYYMPANLGGIDFKFFDEAIEDGLIREDIPFFGKKGIAFRYFPKINFKVESTGKDAGKAGLELEENIPLEFEMLVHRTEDKLG
jgi:hypothetical protein